MPGNLIKSHISKTGSVNSGRTIEGKFSGTKYAIIAGAIMINGETYSYIAQLGPAGTQRDLGPLVYGSDLIPFIKTGLDKLMEDNKK